MMGSVPPWPWPARPLRGGGRGCFLVTNPLDHPPPPDSLRWKGSPARRGGPYRSRSSTCRTHLVSKARGPAAPPIGPQLSRALGRRAWQREVLCPGLDGPGLGYLTAVASGFLFLFTFSLNLLHLFKLNENKTVLTNTKDYNQN